VPSQTRRAHGLWAFVPLDGDEDQVRCPQRNLRVEWRGGAPTELGGVRHRDAEGVQCLTQGIELLHLPGEERGCVECRELHLLRLPGVLCHARASTTLALATAHAHATAHTTAAGGAALLHGFLRAAEFQLLVRGMGMPYLPRQRILLRHSAYEGWLLLGLQRPQHPRPLSKPLPMHGELP
jgi:hypothetical protein